MDITARHSRSRQRLVGRARPAVALLRTIMTLTAIAVLASACSNSPSGASSPSSSAPAGPLALAHCMRGHGVDDYPDPDSSGNFDLSGQGDLNPANPTYQHAAQACRSFGSAGKASEPSLSRQQIVATVEHSQCMRNHGITNYPDPDSGGHVPGIRHFGIDPNSPQFQTAANACNHYMRGMPGWS